MITVAVPANASSHQIETWSSVRAGSRVDRASKIVDTIAITMKGRMMTGCSERTHSTNRSVKNAAV